MPLTICAMSTKLAILSFNLYITCAVGGEANVLKDASCMTPLPVTKAPRLELLFMQLANTDVISPGSRKGKAS